eukprot:jgi/Mesvir1/20966/Mv08033-RA.2
MSTEGLFAKERDRIVSALEAGLRSHQSAENAGMAILNEAMPDLLVQKEPDGDDAKENKANLDHAMKWVLHEMMTKAATADVPVMKYGSGEGGDARGLVSRLLDISLWMCDAGYTDGGAIFGMFEDLVESSTLADCHEVFRYMEAQVGVLGKPSLLSRGKLIMLRTCNELLRRLSKTHDTAFCGRIQLLMTNLFALSERSALNLTRSQNLANLTVCDDEQTADFRATDQPAAAAAADAGTVIDYKFYNTFWGLQGFFQNPVLVLQEDNWATFTRGLESVLTVFKAQSFASSSASAGPLTSAHDAVDDVFGGVKYLTSSTLIGLQLRDPVFQRHFLVQCRILFHALQTLETATLSDTQKEQVAELTRSVNGAIERTPVQGAEFLACVEHILRMEDNWVRWKQEHCYAFEKDPIRAPKVAASTTEEGAKGGVAGLRPKRRKVAKPQEVDPRTLWSSAVTLADLRTREIKVPSVKSYLEPLIEQMDPAAGIEEAYKLKNDKVFCFKAQRLVTRSSFHLFLRNKTDNTLSTIIGNIDEAIPKIFADNEQAMRIVEAAQAAQKVGM